MTTLIEKAADWATTRLARGRSSAQGLHEEETALRERWVALEAERLRLLGGEPPKADALRGLPEAIKTLGATWDAERGLPVVRALATAGEALPPGALRITLEDAFGPLSLPALCAVMPETVHAALAAMIGRVVYEEGAPLSERAARVAAVDKAIEDTVRKHAALVEDAAKKVPPIVLQHLPPTVGRLAQEERHRKDAELFNRMNASAIKRGGVEPMR